jgi:hypothetical protein
MTQAALTNNAKSFMPPFDSGAIIEEVLRRAKNYVECFYIKGEPSEDSPNHLLWIASSAEERAFEVVMGHLIICYLDGDSFCEGLQMGIDALGYKPKEDLDESPEHIGIVVGEIWRECYREARMDAINNSNPSPSFQKGDIVYGNRILHGYGTYVDARDWPRDAKITAVYPETLEYEISFVEHKQRKVIRVYEEEIDVAQRPVQTKEKVDIADIIITVLPLCQKDTKPELTYDNRTGLFCLSFYVQNNPQGVINLPPHEHPLYITHKAIRAAGFCAHHVENIYAGLDVPTGTFCMVKYVAMQDKYTDRVTFTFK